MSVMKYTGKYLMLVILALVVIIGVGGIIYSQRQKNVENGAHPPVAIKEDSTPRENILQKITSRLKKKPKPSHSHGHLDLGPIPPPMEYPRDLKKRLDKVKADGNSYYTNPNYFQEVFDAVSEGRDMETTIKILKEYGIYTDVVLEHMDSYEAFKYALGAPAGYKGPAIKYGERVISEDPSSAEALEAGILLGGEDNLRDVLKYHPNSALALFKLGDLLLEERPGEAIVYLKKATELGKIGDFSNSLDTGDRMLGIAYQYLGDYKSAWVHFKKAQALNPHHPWARGHLELIAKGEPMILPVKRDLTSDAIGQDTAGKHLPIDDTPAPPPEVFVDAFVVPEDVPAAPQDLESASPEAFARQEAEHQAFLEMLREREEFARRLAEDEDFKAEYFKEVEDFINWAETIKKDAPIDTNNFLEKEMAAHLTGKPAQFSPDRLVRANELIKRYGPEEGLERLQIIDPEIAGHLSIPEIKNMKKE